MKKLLSIFAAAVVLFGFASCSGDMHDETAIDMTQLYLRGDMNAWGATPLSQNEDGTWGVKFTASLTTHQFAIATNDGSWSIAYRMTELNGSKCAEYTEDDVAKSSVKKLYHGGGMGNATVPTEVGTDYTLTIVPQLGYLEVSFSKGVTPPTLSVVTGSENKKMELQIFPSKNSKISTDIKDNKLYISLNIKVNADVLTLENDIDYESNEVLEKISSTAETYLTDEFHNYLNKVSKEYNVDNRLPEIEKVTIPVRLDVDVFSVYEIS